MWVWLNLKLAVKEDQQREIDFRSAGEVVFFFKVSATLKIAIFPYLRFQRFQIDMPESFL